MERRCLREGTVIAWTKGSFCGLVLVRRNYLDGDLVTLTGVNYLFLQLIVASLLAAADFLWPGWEPGTTVHRPSTRHLLRHRHRHRVLLFLLDLRRRRKKKAPCLINLHA